MESFGPFCSEGITFLKEAGHWMTIAIGDFRETA